MHWMEKIKDSPNYEKLKNSVQYRFERKQFLSITIPLSMLYLFMLAVELDLICDERSQDVGIVTFLLMSIMVLPLIGYFAYRWLRLFWHIDRWSFSEAVLDKPHAGYKGGVSFTVTVIDRRGNCKQRDTANMFSTGEPMLEDYVNRKVLVGYNEETDLVAVIKRLD